VYRAPSAAPALPPGSWAPTLSLARGRSRDGGPAGTAALHTTAAASQLCDEALDPSTSDPQSAAVCEPTIRPHRSALFVNLGTSEALGRTWLRPIDVLAALGCSGDAPCTKIGAWRDATCRDRRGERHPAALSREGGGRSPPPLVRRVSSPPAGGALPVFSPESSTQCKASNRRQHRETECCVSRPWATRDRLQHQCDG
jgi:hypothetical protein